MVNVSGGRQSSYSEPWKAQQPYLKEIYGQAQNLYGTPRTMYPDSTVVPYSAETEAALGGATRLATEGSPIVRGAQGYTEDVLSGRYLDPARNPWLGRTYESAVRPVTRQFMTSTLPGANLSAYGRGGSGAEANRYNRSYDVYGQTLVDLADKIYGGNYRTERAAQEAAAARAPTLADYDYSRMGRLAGVGEAREAKAGDYLKELMSRYYFAEDEPRERLDQYIAQVGGPVSTSRSRGTQFSLGIGG